MFVMNVEQALNSLNLKEDFLEGFILKCNISRDCVFTRLRVKHDYTQYTDVDAVIVTPQKVHLLEVVTWKGSFKRESKTHWIREQPVLPATSSGESVPAVGSSPTVVSVLHAQVPSPVFEAERKLKYLIEYLKSKIGTGSVGVRDFDYHVVIAVEGCILSEDCLHKVVRHIQIDEFAENLRQSWGGWLAWKLWPFYRPFWITYYNEIKQSILELPSTDRLKLSGGQRLFGEMKSCPGIPYDRTTTSQLRFKKTKTHALMGTPVIEAQGTSRNSGIKMFSSPLQCDIASTLDFLCVGSDVPISIKLKDVESITLGRPLQ